MDKLSQQNQQALTDDLGCAVAATILLSDWGNYGLSERIAYHFHLTEALAAVDRDRYSPSSSISHVCGVVKLLECVPTLPLHRLTRQQKRSLRNSIRNFNQTAERIRTEARQYCHEPDYLPLRLNPATRVYFSYEKTRIALILDASPTITSTFGSVDPDYVCPLDRIGHMTGQLFQALSEPIKTTNSGRWQPDLSVTVMAVYPQGEPSLLVRGYRVQTADHVRELARQMQTWALQTVEAEIAKRLSHKVIPSYHNMESCSSRLSDLIQAGDAALSILSSDARPCIFVATDGRSISCESTLDVVTGTNRSDIPVSILDLSSPNSHGSVSKWIDVEGTSLQNDRGTFFPLHLSDDAEGLYRIAKATGGTFFNQELLDAASKVYAGQVPPDSSLVSDHYLAFKRHSIRPNAVQWYSLFVRSQLSPMQHGNRFGKLEPPDYLRRRLQVTQAGRRTAVPPKQSAGTGSAVRQGLSSSASRIGATLAAGSGSGEPSLHGRRHETAVFATYVINPIRIHGLLLMRVKEGYHAHQYGQSTNDPDKVFILFSLPVDMGIVLYYEVSYKALSHNHMVGVAHVRVEMSGDPGLLQVVKNDFLQSAVTATSASGPYQYSSVLCELLRKTRKEDTNQSFLAPSSWKDQLKSPTTPFVRRLKTLTDMQRRRHFRLFVFEVVCTGMMPYSDDEFLSEFRDSDTGERELKKALTTWSSQVIEEGELYVKKMDNSGELVSYCLVEVSKLPLASRVFAVSVYTFGTFGARERLAILASLKDAISNLKDVKLLAKQIGRYLVGLKSVNHMVSARHRFLLCQHKRASWDLVNDPELLPLLMKRRTEIGGFHLLESNDGHALFAKLLSAGDSGGTGGGPGDLVQYQLNVLPDKVEVDLNMESECGEFHSSVVANLSEFARTIKSLKKRDQECGLALKSRTCLLRALNSSAGTLSELPGEETQSACVRRLIAYSSKVTLQLRFFSSKDGAANDILEACTETMLLAGNFRAQVGRILVGDSTVIKEVGEGMWFIVEFDKHTISLVHFSASNREIEEETIVFDVRDMTFFTVSVGDLYDHRDDDAEDNSEDDHVSEHMRVSDFADNVIEAHRYNYVLACYLALESVSLDTSLRFGSADYEYVMGSLSFVETTRVVVGADLDRVKSKLVAILSTVLQCCPDDEHCFYYFGNSSEDGPIFDGIDDLSDVSSTGVGTEPDSSTGTAHDGVEADSHSTPLEMPFQHEGLLSAPEFVDVAPLFVKLYIDDSPVGFKDLSTIEKSAALSAKVSLYGEADAKFSLLPPHQKVGYELTRLLKAYVAEQNLERLRAQGTTINESDLRLARHCLRKARNVSVLNHELLFYSNKSDSLAPASSVKAAGFAFEEPFEMLSEELQDDPATDLQIFTTGLLVSKEKDDFDSLSYWCFLVIKTDFITAEIFHPDGESSTQNTVERIRAAVGRALFRVNQRLLLRRLSESRTASDLLIAPGIEDTEKPFQDNAERDEKFPPGSFGCADVHSTRFTLFHRCATNPQQVARNLEATVLHIFSITNRRHVFVYKDEAGSIFYMRLHATGGGVEADGEIQLKIHGVDEPPTSVPEQLARLLRKRLMNIATDMLSSVLVQNPGYSWKSEDLDYVWNFQAGWKSLEDNESSQEQLQERLYVLPGEVSDPGMVMLYFRQNICGSTHFNALKSLDWPPLGDSDDCATTLDFVFYYNDSPSKLDPKFQAISTLTPKGLELSRKIGPGIAVIELSLLDSKGNPVQDLNFGVNSQAPTQTVSQPESFLLRRLGDDEVAGSDDKQFFHVKITGTNVKVDYLHEWVHLSLNQGAASLTIEKCMRGTTDHFVQDRELPQHLPVKDMQIEKLVPGITFLTGILRTCLELPHPGVLASEHLGDIRSSSVARVATELLEGVIFDQLRKEAPSADFSQNVHVLRMSRDNVPRRVDLAGRGVSVTVSDHSNQCVIVDNPADCPEYLCFYYSAERRSGHDPIPKLFHEVMIGSSTEKSKSRDINLESLKEKHQEMFRRRFAFILSVKRNRRYLMTYNWNPQLQKTVISRLREKESEFLVTTDRTTCALFSRSLGLLSPRFTASVNEKESDHATQFASQQSMKPVQRNSETETLARTESNEQTRVEPLRKNGPRRAIRPVSIRRPVLIGRSIEGSAAHAAAASRERAKSSRFRSARMSTTNSASLRRTQSKDGAPALVNTGKSKPQSFSRRQEKISTVVTREEQNMRLLRKSIEVSALDSQRRRSALTSKRLTVQTSSLLRHSKEVETRLLDFLVQNSVPVWIESYELPRLPDALMLCFEKTLAHAISTWHPSLKLMKVTNGSTQESPFFIMGVTRNVRGCKCFPVLRLRLDNNVTDKASSGVLRCDGWLMTKPRMSRSNRRVHSLRYYHLASLREKDAMGLKLLPNKIQKALSITAIFDFMGMISEVAVASTYAIMGPSEACDLTLQLENRYALKDQVRIPQLRYNAYVAHIVLKSYRDPVITMYTGPQLYDWLYRNAESNGLREAGARGLYFQEDIVVRGTVSYCFLTVNKNDKNRMMLHILCRNNGCNLYDFMFRMGSTVALSTADVIAVEAAGMALNRLKRAATCLRRDNLWARASRAKGSQVPRQLLSTGEMEELLSYCAKSTVNGKIGSGFDILEEFIADISGFRLSMAAEPLFQPYRVLSASKYLYYCSTEDIFICATGEGSSTSLEFIERSVDPTRQSRVYSKLVNFALHTQWHLMVE